MYDEVLIHTAKNLTAISDTTVNQHLTLSSCPVTNIRNFKFGNQMQVVELLRTSIPNAAELAYLPKTLNQLTLEDNEQIASYHNIQHVLAQHRIEQLYVDLNARDMLGWFLLNIANVTMWDPQVEHIINSSYPHDVFSIQEQLIDAGLELQARI